MPTKYRFLTNGDFVDFYDDAMLVRTFPTDYSNFGWYYDNKPGISIFFDGGVYHFDNVGDISFNDVALESKEGFKAALGTLFPHYATTPGGGVEGITSDGSIATYNIADQTFNATSIRFNSDDIIIVSPISIQHQIFFTSGATSQIIMKSPNGSSWVVSVGDDGQLTAEGD